MNDAEIAGIDPPPSSPALMQAAAREQFVSPTAARRHPDRLQRAALVLVGAMVAAVFIVDTTTPFGLGVPFLYLLAVLVAMGTRQSNRVLLALAILCPLLAAAKLLAPAADGVLEFGQGNRLIFSFLMWTLVGLELLRRRCEARIMSERARINRDLEKLVRERTEALHLANAELRTEVAERQQAERSVRDYGERAQRLAEQLDAAQESERARLAAELHDRIGQNLSALNISLSLHLAGLPAATAANARARIRDALALVEQTTEMVRGVMEELHPTLLDQYGLAAALRWYGEEFTERTGIPVVYAAPETFPRLRPKVETTLFRIVQEAATNVAKHAAATRVALSLTQTGAGIELAVADDGIGMDTAQARQQPAGSGWGLPLMAERARSIGAQLQIDSEAGRGTRIALVIAKGLWEPEHDHQRTDR